MGKYLKKGSPIYVEGKLQTRKWTGDDDVDRYVTEIIGLEMQLMGKKDSKDTQQGPQSGEFDPPPARDNFNEYPSTEGYEVTYGDEE